jgi:hypothetical protein
MIDHIEMAIRHACVAGGCRLWARTDERVSSGLNRCADQHSRAATLALNEWLSAIGGDSEASADAISAAAGGPPGGNT